MASNPHDVKTLESLQERLGYTFSNTQYLKLALTHSSFSATNNVRLEFLGDSVLRLILSDELFHTLPSADPGTLTQQRVECENNVHLAEIARTLGLDECMLLGKGARRDGGGHSNSSLAGAMEALLAAVYLDSSLATVRDVVFAHIVPHLPIHKHPKTLLQERLMQQLGELPSYEVMSSDTNARHNDATVNVQCVVNALELKTEGTGATRKEAETAAAIEMLRLVPL
ncbi:MAG: ribonuclease III [Gammaproteobacteria bacterium]|nr:ribonuclease III [Gammaproteobacteria bacterium]